jgi:hypothetical protein
VDSITKAAEKVGMDTIIISDVAMMAHEKRDIFIIGKSGCFIFRMVTTKFIEPSNDEKVRNVSAYIHISAAGAGAFSMEYGG